MIKNEKSENDNIIRLKNSIALQNNVLRLKNLRPYDYKIV